MIALYIFLSLLGLFIIYYLTLLIIFKVLHFKLFHHHEKALIGPLYIDYSDYKPYINRTPIKILTKKDNFIQAYLYEPKSKPLNYRGLIVLSHGFLSEHTKYLPEIKLLIDNGYLILAYDNLANGESSGKNQKSLYHSYIDLDIVLKYVTSNPELSKYPLGLYGHSWGGFAVNSVNHTKYNVKAVFALSGFEQESQTILDGLEKYYKIIVKLCRPFAKSFTLFICGPKTFKQASHQIKKSKKTTFMLVHATNDHFVKFKHSATYACLKKKAPNAITKVFTRGGHKLFYSMDSKQVRQNASTEYKKLLKKYDNDIPQKVISLFELNFPKVKLYEPNKVISELIISFYKTNLK